MKWHGGIVLFLFAMFTDSLLCFSIYDISLGEKGASNTFSHGEYCGILCKFQHLLNMCLIFNLKVCICGLSCILPVYMDCAPCAFNKLILPIKKNKSMTYLCILPSMASIFCVGEFYLWR